MAPLPDRRGLLRGLATLPLIGGSVALVGRPSAAAVPVTPGLLDAYDAWLDLERSFLKWERWGPEAESRPGFVRQDVRFYDRQTGETFECRPGGPANAYHFGGRHADPSTRAAIVLSAVGCSWHDRSVLPGLSGRHD